jgi:protein-disulfide isomerase
MPEQNSNKPLVNTLLVIALVIAAGAIGHLWTKAQYLEGQANNVAGAQVGNTPDTAPTPPPFNADNLEPLSDSDLIRGNKDAKIVLFEYSDLECPFCSRFHPTAQQALDEYGSEIAWVYRHFPLAQIHPKAQKFAEVVECTKNLNGNDLAWQIIDAIFEDQTVTVDQATDMAIDLGVNSGALNSCLDGDETADYIAAQLSAGEAAGITGTPGTIILNTETGQAELIRGAQPFDQIKQTIDSLK